MVPGNVESKCVFCVVLGPQKTWDRTKSEKYGEVNVLSFSINPSSGSWEKIIIAMLTTEVITNTG